MNEEIVSSTNKREEDKVLHVWPPQKCFHCNRLTVVAHLDPAFAPTFQPKCALHGLVQPSNADATPEEKEFLLASVARFVVWMHACQGRVVLVSPLEHLVNAPPPEQVWPSNVSTCPQS